jgi:hypothetical protein
LIAADSMDVPFVPFTTQKPSCGCYTSIFLPSVAEAPQPPVRLLAILPWLFGRE